MIMRVRGWIRVGSTIAVGLGLAAFLTVLSSPVARAKTSHPVYFFSNNAQPINSHNPLVMRPSGFVLFLDGQWVLQDLHWTGWGSSVARATGISNSSNDIPNAANGKRIKTWADMTLSSPVRWRGHEVYSCFKILVPPPASDLSGCVLPNPPIGNGWLLGGAGGQVEFLAPGQKIWCGVGAGSSFCIYGNPGNPASFVGPALGANLLPNGKVTFCSVPHASLSTKGGCAENWDASSPVLKFGQEIRADNFLCKSERIGIACTIASGRHKGKGFLISSKLVRQLG
jgi:hypothetical protein